MSEKQEHGEKVKNGKYFKRLTGLSFKQLAISIVIMILFVILQIALIVGKKLPFIMSLARASMSDLNIERIEETMTLISLQLGALLFFFLLFAFIILGRDWNLRRYLQQNAEEKRGQIS